jgi:subtilisin family serine protease
MSKLIIASFLGLSLAEVDQYIIRLHAHADLEQHLTEMRGTLGSHMQTLHVYENMGTAWLGYSAKLTPHALEAVRRHSGVHYVEQDKVVTLSDCQQQKKPDWGLARSNVRKYDKSKKYTYDYTTSQAGLGVDAYIIDTGIYCENREFTKKVNGTCTFGYSAVYDESGALDTTDGNGHGTHVAGTVGGYNYGIAKEASLIAVKVLSDSGSGWKSDVISGIDWSVIQTFSFSANNIRFYIFYSMSSYRDMTIVK